MAEKVTKQSSWRRCDSNGHVTEGGCHIMTSVTGRGGPAASIVAHIFPPSLPPSPLPLLPLLSVPHNALAMASVQPEPSNSMFLFAKPPSAQVAYNHAPLAAGSTLSQPIDLRHVTSNGNLASPVREHRLSKRTSGHLRTHRVGSRSPNSIPSSPTSVYVSPLFSLSFFLSLSALSHSPHPF